MRMRRPEPKSWSSRIVWAVGRAFWWTAAAGFFGAAYLATMPRFFG